MLSVPPMKSGVIALQKVGGQRAVRDSVVVGIVERVL